MELKILQEQIEHAVGEMKTPFRSGAEIIVALTEELGEIGVEVALLEQIGNKTEWSRLPSEAQLAEEIIHAMNLLLALANQYEIDMTHAYQVYQEKNAT